MTTVHDWTLRLKRPLSRASKTPAIGRLVARLLHDRIRHHGNVVDTDHPSITAETKASIFWGSYERAETSLLKRYLDASVDVVELGSSIGVVSSHIARRLSGGRRLVCVEANEALLGQIRRNVALNAPSARCDILHGAIDYSTDGPTVPFLVAAQNVQSRLARVDEPAQQVPRRTLGEIVASFDTAGFSLVCDIEGAEHGLISAEAESLARCQSLVIELHDIPGQPDAISQTINVLENRDHLLLQERRGDVCAFARSHA